MTRNMYAAKRMQKIETATQLGNAAYVQHVASDTVTAGELAITFGGLRTIDSLAGVHVYGNGYVVIPRRITANTVKCSVYPVASHAHGALANHAHDILVTGGAGAAGTNTVQASAAAGPLTKQEAATATIAGGGASGVQNASGGTPAAVSTAAGVLTELTAGQNISGVTFYASAVGY